MTDNLPYPTDSTAAPDGAHTTRVVGRRHSAVPDAARANMRLRAAELELMADLQRELLQGR